MSPKITVNLHPDIVAAIRKIADTRGCSMTEALRWAIENERAVVAEPRPEPEPGFCGLCGKTLPEGEEMFKYHGSSGPCPSDDRASASEETS